MLCVWVWYFRILFKEARKMYFKKCTFYLVNSPKASTALPIIEVYSYEMSLVCEIQ